MPMASRMPSWASTINSCGRTWRTSRSSGRLMLRAASMAWRTSSRSISRARLPRVTPARELMPNVPAGDADQRRFDRHAGNAFSLFDRAANGTDRGIEVDNGALAQALGFGRSEREEFDLILGEFRDQHASLGAADVQPYEILILFRQSPLQL